ncbi:MAG: VOC family protein [Novosphingobium sp.]|nr:VOC family protein [Novosphingobium sp.]
MIGYVTLGTNDLERSGKFYRAIMDELGVELSRTTEKSMSWGKFGGGRGLSITKPFDGDPACLGNGMMIALEARDHDQVHKVHELALANGGSDEGEPGTRGGSVFYGGYFRDPDGNKLCVYNMPEQ